ncbi:MAG: hypothetical protein ACM31D_00385 [Bacteroidota bacterium]
MDKVSSSSSGLVIPPGAPVLRLADLMKEAEGMPVENVDLGNGVVVERRSNFSKMVGEAKMSLRAKITAMEAARVGGQAGRAMFDTFRKTHPEEFGDAAVARDKAMLSGEMPPPPSPEKTPQGTRVEVQNGGTYEADPKTAVVVNGGKNVTVTGSAVDDFFNVLYGSTVYGLAGNDRIHGQKRATLDGGDGDDVLSAYEDSTLGGGDGNDILEAYDRSVLDGGSGDDRLSAYDDAVADGGDGDDRISAYDRSQVTDRAGDNDIQVYSDSWVTTGSGNDVIQAGDKASIQAGAGNNWVGAGSFSTLGSGAGDDMLRAGAFSTIDSGAGDDTIVAGRNSEVTAGTGNDRLTLEGGATVHFNRGDGNDIIGGGAWGQAYQETDHLSSSIVSFGTGIVPADLTMRRQGNDLLVQVGSDSLTLKDVQRHGIPTMSFADGSVLRGADVEAMVGPADAYQPASQLMQRFYDASRAYANQRDTTGTAV